jgi:hypothetical protein
VGRDLSARYDVERYRPLGLLANPFPATANEGRFEGAEIETAATANTLLGAIVAASEQAAPKPIVVIKAPEIPGSYPLRAVGLTERSLATDDGVNVLHAYVQLFMLRIGRVRSIISVVAERLAFRDFDQTLALYIERVLAEPDTELAAYQLLGQDGLAAFGETFAADPLGTTKSLFRGEAVERRPEFAELADSRAEDLPSDVDEDEVALELDATVGDSPANAILLAQTEEDSTSDDADRAVVNYIVEHTKVHLSPVVARALRVYRERGQMAMINELKVTKAPKKTLAAIVKFARVRFKKVVIIFDGFDGWYAVPPELKAQIASTFSEVRWMLEHDAVMVFALEEDRVPELEEQFGHGTRLRWSFDALQMFEADADRLDMPTVDVWLARAATPGATPISIQDPVLSGLAGDARGFAEFAFRAATAIESAAERGVSALDEVAEAEARAAEPAEAK